MKDFAEGLNFVNTILHWNSLHYPIIFKGASDDNCS